MTLKNSSGSRSGSRLGSRSGSRLFKSLTKVYPSSLEYLLKIVSLTTDRAVLASWSTGSIVGADRPLRG